MTSKRKYPDLPRVGVGALVMKEGSVLLVQRKGEPAAGLWAIPGGNLKLGETICACAEREIMEETGIVIRAGEILYTFETIERDKNGRVRFHYVVVDVAAEYVSGEPAAADDALAARWVSLADMAAFPLARSTREFLSRIRVRSGDGERVSPGPFNPGVSERGSAPSAHLDPVHEIV